MRQRLATHVKVMGFFRNGLWVTDYGRFMGYGFRLCGNRLGSPKMSWFFGGYGVLDVWVKGGSTVPTYVNIRRLKYFYHTKPHDYELRDPFWITYGGDYLPVILDGVKPCVPYIWDHRGWFSNIEDTDINMSTPGEVHNTPQWQRIIAQVSRYFKRP